MIRAGYGFDRRAVHRHTARPQHRGEDVGVRAAALAERPHRQDPAFPAEPGNALRVVGKRPDDSGDARAMPGTVAVLAGAEHPARRLRRRHPVAGIGRVRVPAVTVVRPARLADEVEARQQPASRAGPQKVRVIVANPGVQVRDDHAGAAGREIPRAHGIDCARSRGRVLQIPLAREQRIVRHRVREASQVGLGELDVRVRTQDREIRVHVRTGGRRGDLEHLQHRTEPTRLLERDPGTRRQRRDFLRRDALRRGLLRSRGCRNRTAELDDDPAGAVLDASRRFGPCRVELRREARDAHTDAEHGERDQSARSATAAR